MFNGLFGWKICNFSHSTLGFIQRFNSIPHIVYSFHNRNLFIINITAIIKDLFIIITIIIYFDYP